MTTPDFLKEMRSAVVYPIVDTTTMAEEPRFTALLENVGYTKVLPEASVMNISPQNESARSAGPSDSESMNRR